MTDLQINKTNGEYKITNKNPQNVLYFKIKVEIWNKFHENQQKEVLYQAFKQWESENS